MIEITKEMLNRIHTDSDIEDLADELGVDIGELDYAISNHYAKDSKCYNCKYVGMGMMFPCNSCSRKHPKDYYESILEEGN